MTDIQAWLDQGRRLADQATEGPWVARPDNPSMAGETWSLRVAGKPGLRASVVEYQHGPGNMEFITDARTRLPQALNALQAVLDMHHDSGDGLCNECSDGFLVNHPCPTVRAIQDAIGEHDD